MIKTLFKHEFRKITRKKSVMVACICLMLCITVLSALFIAETSYTNEDGNRINGVDAISLHKSHAEQLEGALTTEKLATVLAHYKTIVDEPQNYISLGTGEQSISDDVFGREIQPYEDVLDLMRRASSPAGVYDYYSLSSVTPEDMTNFYDQRTALVGEILDMDYSTGNYTDAEKEYFLTSNSEIEIPFYYTYTEGWYDMLTRGFLSILLLIAFVICICISPVFASEYQTGADSIILSSKYGKNKLIGAKILSSIAFTTVLYALSMLLFTVVMLAFHGVSGWNAPFQLTSFYSVYPITMLQVYLYGLAIGYIIIISIMAIVLLFSALAKAPFSAVIVGALYIFVPMFLPSSKTSLLINDALALLPAKAMDAFSVFSVYSSYSIGGQIISLPAAILLFSACVILLALPLAYSRFKRHQVG